MLALEPELVLPSHGPAIRGGDEIRRQLTRYRDGSVHRYTTADGLPTQVPNVSVSAPSAPAASPGRTHLKARREVTVALSCWGSTLVGRPPTKRTSPRVSREISRTAAGCQ